MMWLVDLRYACFGIVTDNRDVVVEAPPIARWMVGKPITTIGDWVARKRGTMTPA
jgi:hypothetical protein